MEPRIVEGLLFVLCFWNLGLTICIANTISAGMKTLDSVELMYQVHHDQKVKEDFYMERLSRMEKRLRQLEGGQHETETEDRDEA